jgi:hypothetical protein
MYYNYAGSVPWSRLLGLGQEGLDLCRCDSAWGRDLAWGDFEESLGLSKRGCTLRLQHSNDTAIRP